MMKTQIVEPYLKKYGDDFPSLTLARIIYKENVSSFKDIKAAYGIVRYLRGAKGKKDRDKLKNKEFATGKKRTTANAQYLMLPKSWAKEKEVYHLPKSCNKIGFISDHQVPFHDTEAVETCYKWLQEKEVNTIFINGDFLDFFGISSFLRDPRRRNFREEYFCILQSLEHLRDWFPTERIFYNLDANHEARYEKYMMIKAPEVLSLDLPEFTLESLLKLDAFDITPIRSKDHIMIGKLPVVHGHTIFNGATSPVSTARTVFMKTKRSAIASHCHQVSEYTTRTLGDEIITCWTTGCLMSTNVEYNPHGNNYSHGFAYIETEKDGSYRVENKRIFKGKVL